MAIEVLSLAKPPQRVEFSCTRCHATLRAGLDDSVAKIVNVRDGDAALFECPSCKTAVWVALELFFR